jgi:hypothetical protein
MLSGGALLQDQLDLTKSPLGASAVIGSREPGDGDGPMRLSTELVGSAKSVVDL